MSEVEKKLEARGVFLGAHGLEGFANAHDFWDKQPYGKRLYYGDGNFDYLHLDVLNAAIAELASAPSAIGAITSNEAEKYLDEGFDIKVLNPEHGTYWRCSYCGNDDKGEHDEGCLIRRLVKRALAAAPVAATGGEAVAWVRTLNGKIDWSEDCLHTDGKLGEYEGLSEYAMMPLYAAPQPVASAPEEKDMVPRSRYDACNADWLAAKAEAKSKQELLTKVGRWIEQYQTTREVVDAMSRDALDRAALRLRMNNVRHTGG